MTEFKYLPPGATPYGDTNLYRTAIADIKTTINAQTVDPSSIITGTTGTTANSNQYYLNYPPQQTSYAINTVDWQTTIAEPKEEPKTCPKCEQVTEDFADYLCTRCRYGV